MNEQMYEIYKEPPTWHM